MGRRSALLSSLWGCGLMPMVWSSDHSSEWQEPSDFPSNPEILTLMYLEFFPLPLYQFLLGTVLRANPALQEVCLFFFMDSNKSKHHDETSRCQRTATYESKFNVTGSDTSCSPSYVGNENSSITLSLDLQKDQS